MWYGKSAMNSKIQLVIDFEFENWTVLIIEFWIRNSKRFQLHRFFNYSGFQKKFRLNLHIHFNDICRNWYKYTEILFRIWKIRKSEIALAWFCKTAFFESSRSIQTYHPKLVSSISLFSISFVISMFHLLTDSLVDF